MDTGWIKLYRKLLDDVVWIKSTNEQRVILITILLMANHEEKEWEWQGEKFKVSPGQFITSLDSIIKATGDTVSLQNVRSALKRFEKLGFLTNKSTKTGRLITIEKWNVYQSSETDGNKDTNKDLTKRSQRGNKDLTPNKNDKNDKNTNLIKIQEYYETTIGGLINPSWLREIEEFTGESKLDVCLVNEIFKAVAANKDKCNLSYIKTVLSNWIKGGITTLEKLEEDRKAFEERKQKTNGKGSRRTNRTDTKPVGDKFDEYMERNGISAGSYDTECDY